MPFQKFRTSKNPGKVIERLDGIFAKSQKEAA